jgi:hypothetical protein
MTQRMRSTAAAIDAIPSKMDAAAVASVLRFIRATHRG